MNHLASFDLIILFFILGAAASWMNSDLDVPEPVSKFLSIFLLLSLGLKGGHEVRTAENLDTFLPSLGIGLFSCFILPVILFFSLKNRLSVANASALSASYGSVSAVTFVTAQGLLESRNIDFSGYMVAVMALMELPAILIAVYFYQKSSLDRQVNSLALIKSIFSSKSVVLLVGGFLIGLSMNQASWDGISPVIQNCFKGVLAFFLLDLGIIAYRQMGEAWKYRKISLPIALLVPLMAGSFILVMGHLIGVSMGNQVLLAVLAGSASYIAAPAAVRSSIPEANPSLYLAMPLALTFPMNLILGIPFYIEMSSFLIKNF